MRLTMILYRLTISDTNISEFVFQGNSLNSLSRTAVRGAESKHSLCIYTFRFSLKIIRVSQAHLACWDNPKPLLKGVPSHQQNLIIRKELMLWQTESENSSLHFL